MNFSHSEHFIQSCNLSVCVTDCLFTSTKKIYIYMLIFELLFFRKHCLRLWAHIDSCIPIYTACKIYNLLDWLYYCNRQFRGCLFLFIAKLLPHLEISLFYKSSRFLSPPCTNSIVMQMCKVLKVLVKDFLFYSLSFVTFNSCLIVIQYLLL